MLNDYKLSQHRTAMRRLDQITTGTLSAPAYIASMVHQGRAKAVLLL